MFEWKRFSFDTPLVLCYALCGRLLCKSKRDLFFDTPLVLCYALCGRLLCKSGRELSFESPILLVVCCICQAAV